MMALSIRAFAFVLAGFSHEVHGDEGGRIKAVTASGK
jgi:hypothetical protein